jgi:hypothetical protein
MNFGSELRALRLRYLNRQLRDFELQEPDPEELLPLTEAEVRADLTGSATGRFLGYFSRRGLVRMGLTFGIIRALRERGFNPVMKLGTADQQHTLRIYDGVEDPDHLVVDIAAHLEHSSPKAALGLPPGQYGFLVIDWMLLQDPRASFTASRPRLPGQHFPGLRLGEDIGNVIMLVGERLRQDGVLTFPNHYHNGVLYSRKMLFANPRYQAELVALGRDLSSLSLAERSWAVELGCVEYADGAVYGWRGTEMIFPITKALQEHFASAAYHDAVEREAARMRFKLDMDKLIRAYEPL